MKGALDQKPKLGMRKLTLFCHLRSSKEEKGKDKYTNNAVMMDAHPQLHLASPKRDISGPVCQRFKWGGKAPDECGQNHLTD